MYDNNKNIMMADSSTSPIDLSVPKQNSISPKQQLHPQNTIYSPSRTREYQAINPKCFNSTEQWLLKNSTSELSKNNQIPLTIITEDFHRPRSTESGINSPYSSPENRLDKLETTALMNPRVKIEENCDRMRTKRRGSQSSTSSSLSNYTGDSNNNENIGRTQFIKDTMSPCSSPEKKKPRTISNTTLPVHLREIPSPDQSRLALSPSSTYNHENDYCDSSTRSRPARPFKVITSGMIIEPLPSLSGPLGDFETFRQSILSKVNASNKSCNLNMRRQGNAANAHITDPTYWEKRKRNNEAAKRSRDARKRKEDEVAIRCAYLEQERILMMQENRILKETLQKYQLGLIR